MQETPNSFSNIETKVKKMVIFLGILLVFGVALLIISLVLKSKNSSTSSVSTNKTQGVRLGEQNINLLPTNCSPINIIYKENYIALTSKKCAVIKVINPNGKVTSYHY